MMGKTRFSGQYSSIPNLLSYFRLLLVPLIVWLYCVRKNFNIAALMMAVSAATDVADGWIARHFNLVTDWGKIVDPLADKLTQIAVALCLTWRYPTVWVLLGFLLVKEIYMGLVGLIFIKKTDMVKGSVWHGKAATVAFFFLALVLILLPNLKEGTVAAMVGAECALLLLSQILYTLRYFRIYRQMQEEGTLPEAQTKSL